MQTKQKQLIEYFVKEKGKSKEQVEEIGPQCGWDKAKIEQAFDDFQINDQQFQGYGQYSSQYNVTKKLKFSYDQDNYCNNFSQDSQPEKIQKKNDGYPVGVQDQSNACNFNQLLQIIFYNPKLVEQILEYKMTESNQQGDVQPINKNFIQQLQVVIAKQLMLNQQYFHPKEFYKAIQNFEKKVKQSSQLNEKFLDVIEYLTIFLELIDSSFSKNFEKQHYQQNIFLNELLEKQYIIKQEEQHQIQWAMSIKHLQIYNFLYKEITENKIQIKELPQNLIFTIERNIQKNKKTEKTEEKFNFPIKLYLDFVLGDKQAFQKVQKYIIEQSKNLPNYYQINKQVEAFEKVVNYYKTLNMYEEFILKSLKFEHQKKVDELKKQFPMNQDLLNKELYNSSNNLYQLAQIISHVGIKQEGDYYLYQYNFCLKKWFRYYEKQITMQDEEEVMADTIKNGIILIYLSQEQKKEVQRYQNELNEIDKIRDKLNNLVVHNLLNKIPKDIYMKVLEENKQFQKQFKDQNKQC